MCCKLYHVIFSTFPLNFKCKIWVQKDVIPNFKNHILVTWPATNLLILSKWCRFEKPNDPLIVFRRQNHITFIFIKTMSHDLLVQMAYIVRRSTAPMRHAPELQKKNYWSALFQKWLCAPCNWHSTWREVSTVVHETSCDERDFVLKWHSG